ncbi:hypothetical protein [Myroides fluvii]|uniref:hypothetical protein n=1 Tax=Myroides fluvii TaxID=2572594 RepID=UPI00131C6B10|nr:hypothetical protein [Myroides fluvii]
MCRYSMTTYKPHYACFDCQKTFKRRLWKDIRKGDLVNSAAKCPQCGNLMADMGKDFEAPKKGDDKAWKHIKDLYQVGFIWYSCGCVGPGYIPRDYEALLLYFTTLKTSYEKELLFWRARIEPETKTERIKDDQRNWHKYYKIKPNRKKGGITNQEGIDYWIAKIKEVEEKILFLREKK